MLAGVRITGLHVDEGGKFAMMRVKSSLKSDATAPLNPLLSIQTFPKSLYFYII
jgi:hypothetical protein